mgnify:CR=1 FL=1
MLGIHKAVTISYILVTLCICNLFNTPQITVPYANNAIQLKWQTSEMPALA